MYDSNDWSADPVGKETIHVYPYGEENAVAFVREAQATDNVIIDNYPCEEFVFSSYGCDLHIDNELVANAFAALPKQEQSILILFCVLELGDGEIGDLMGMSRSAVQRHQTKTLNELRKKLKAHLPEGG